jgi:hypothetical protein
LRSAAVNRCACACSSGVRGPSGSVSSKSVNSAHAGRFLFNPHQRQPATWIACVLARFAFRVRSRWVTRNSASIFESGYESFRAPLCCARACGTRNCFLSPLPSTYPFSAQARLGGVLGYLRDAPSGAERGSRVLECPEEIGGD